MKHLLSTTPGKTSITFFTLATALLTTGTLWTLLTTSTRQADLAEGVLRLALLLAAIGLVLAATHRTELRRRNK